MKRIFFILFLSFRSAVLLNAADWPQMAGPNGDWISGETNLNQNWASKPPPLLWKADLGEEGHGAPIVAEGKVFILAHTNDQDLIRAYDLESGKLAWETAYAETSKPKYGYTHTTPAYDQGRVYTVSLSGKVHSVDSATGAIKWTKDLVKDYGGTFCEWLMVSSPLVDGNRVVLCPGGSNSVVALDKQTGKTLWMGGVADSSGCGMPDLVTLHGVRQYLVFTKNQLAGIKPENGSVIWQFPWDHGTAKPLLLDSERIFLTTCYWGDCGVIRVQPWKASEIWHGKKYWSNFASLIFYKGFIYGIVSPQGELICIDPSNYEPKWRHPGFADGPLIIADQVILALNGRSGELVMVRANSKSYQELGRSRPLGGRSWTAPVLSDGRLLIRNDNTLACLDLRPTTAENQPAAGQSPAQ